MHYQSLSEIKQLTMQQNLHLKEILELKKDFFLLQQQNTVLLEELNQVKSKNLALVSKVDNTYNAIILSIVFQAVFCIFSVYSPTGVNGLNNSFHEFMTTFFRNRNWQVNTLHEHTKKLDEIIAQLEQLSLESASEHSELVAAALDVIDKSI